MSRAETMGFVLKFSPAKIELRGRVQEILRTKTPQSLVTVSDVGGGGEVSNSSFGERHSVLLVRLRPVEVLLVGWLGGLLFCLFYS